MIKASTTIEEQIFLLERRGLSVPGEERVKLTRFLLDVNYYRASGYWKYFQQAPHLGDERFVDGTELSLIRDVYEFDHGLRQLLLEGLSIFEIAFRSRFAYFYSQYCDGYSWPTPSVYNSGRSALAKGQMLDEMAKELSRSKEPFIIKYRESGRPIPIWVAVEALSMGSVSKMYELVRDEDVRHRLSKSFEFPKPEIAISTVRSLTILRNICAHHGRVWNRVPQFAPPVLKSLKTDADKSIYGRTPWAWIVSLGNLVDRVNRNQKYSQNLFGYIGEYPEFLDGLMRPHHR